MTVHAYQLPREFVAIDRGASSIRRNEGRMILRVVYGSKIGDHESTSVNVSRYLNVITDYI